MTKLSQSTMMYEAPAPAAMYGFGEKDTYIPSRGSPPALYTCAHPQLGNASPVSTLQREVMPPPPPRFEEVYEVPARPLHACPGLPRPNHEMKYFSWKSVKCDSSVNLEEMEHHDHSNAKKENEETPSQSIEKQEVMADAKVGEIQNAIYDEINAAMTLSSCFSRAKEGRTPL